MASEFDVAIIGGGPAGSTVGTLLKKYSPALAVAIFEAEVFPRDHVGESLLPPTAPILAEMGCWDEVEAAGFPIKIGASYRWGRRPERWNFDFFPAERFVDEPRPARYEGQRLATSFQVDRAVYDQILIQHAAKLGCSVFENARVKRVARSGDRVTSLEIETGETVTARYYVDASGNNGILRRAMEVECQYPTTLRNIAIYDYWQNAEWAVEIGVGATRVQILSLPYGWIWFIPLGPTRTSIGLVVPADFYKLSGKTPRELYRQALRDESIVAGLIQNAESEGKLRTTRDWSFIAERQSGENWFLVGESGGFADPILSAGVSMAQIAAQQLACTILEMERGRHPALVLKQQYDRRQSERIRTHIRFADYWYTSNAQFSDLKDFTKSLASDIGLDLTPDAAWAWLAQGGFIDEDLYSGIGGFTLSFLRTSGGEIFDFQPDSPFLKHNTFQLDLSGAEEKPRAEYREGTVELSRSYVRGAKALPVAGPYRTAVAALQRATDITQIVQMLRSVVQERYSIQKEAQEYLAVTIQALESMVNDGWVKASFNPHRPLLNIGYTVPAVKWAPDEDVNNPSPKGLT